MEERQYRILKVCNDNVNRFSLAVFIIVVILVGGTVGSYYC